MYKKIYIFLYITKKPHRYIQEVRSLIHTRCLFWVRAKTPNPPPLRGRTAQQCWRSANVCFWSSVTCDAIKYGNMSSCTLCSQPPKFTEIFFDQSDPKGRARDRRVFRSRVDSPLKPQVNKSDNCTRLYSPEPGTIWSCDCGDDCASLEYRTWQLFDCSSRSLRSEKENMVAQKRFLLSHWGSYVFVKIFFFEILVSEYSE